MPLLCERPHARYVDFDTSRFVVSDPAGLNLGDRILEWGEEIPRGVLDARALRLEYEHPMQRIQLLSYVIAHDPELREAHARKTGLDPRPKLLDDLESLTRSQLVQLCEKQGLPSDGSKTDLRNRLAASIVA